jgi:restriction system protein
MLSILKEIIEEPRQAHYTQLQPPDVQLLDEFDHAFIERQIDYAQPQLADPQVQSEIARWSPSFHVLKRLQAVANLDSLSWRELEELAAELLQQDGYKVELGPGRGDGGVDIVAIKELGELGLFKAVWQAKKMKPGNKVGISVIRELADTRIEHKASKGILLTSTYLTRGALQRVQRDEYVLGKVDRDDLLKWIERVERGHRR